ncbi:MAG: outer membrane beta-barrel protein [Bacteroidales bacterium]|nr:outer membrane beta-barrel protein [Bacteroidales bacterium]
MRINILKLTTLITILLSAANMFAQNSGTLSGVVLDKKSGEPVIGATIFIESLKKGASTDLEGKYSITGVLPGTYIVRIDCISYVSIIVEDLKVTQGVNNFDIILEENATLLNEAVVTSAKRMNSDIAIVQATRSAGVVMSGISGRQISKSQDRSAAEVVKRIPGVSILNDRYIIVRGLSGRYNNVWINNSAVPSTDADTRSFSFDLLPSSQLESIMIVKSPSAEIPSDFSGGFVKILTKSMPDVNDISISYGMNFNTATHFKDHLFNSSSPTKELLFDTRMDNNNPDKVTDITRNGFKNNWQVKSHQPFPDQRLNFMMNRNWSLGRESSLGLVAAVNYSHSYQTYSDMLNARFGVYNTVSDKSEYIYNYIDNQYSIDDKIGVMLNLTLLNKDSKIEFRNIFNRLDKDRYTTREGWQNISAMYIQDKKEYFTSTRTTYTGQFLGSGKAGSGDYDWNASYSYAGMEQPDRRIINREENNIYGDEYFGHMAIDQNEITRDFSQLDEHIFAAAANYTLPVLRGLPTPAEFKAGLYGEYKIRDYSNRQFFYRFNTYGLPRDFVYRDVVEKILSDENYAHDKLYIYEDTDNRNSYMGTNGIGSAYLSFKLPAGRFNFLAGLRYEMGTMKLTLYDKIYEFSTYDKTYNHADLFPSLNISYNIDRKNLIRFAYGSSVNRQEFREVSPSVYYDFSLFSDVKGNPDLKQAKIHNADIRFEHYPSDDEYITLALFYKYFKNPIEWTYLDAGGSYTYTFENALSAQNYGVELDIKKRLDFIGLKNFTFGINAALISSIVDFDQAYSLEKDRAMQGQSPYIVNATLYYDNPNIGLSLGLLYNRIGRRIVGIGRVDTSSGGSINNDVPDTYELPRDVVDFVATKSIGRKIEIRLSMRDILNQPVVFEQYPRYIDGNGVIQNRRQVAKSFNPGAGIYLGIMCKF